MERTIFALFDDALAALGVASAFEREGYPREAISLVVPDPRGRYARPPADGAAPKNGPPLRVFTPLEAPGLDPVAVTGPLGAPLSDGIESRGGLEEALGALGLSGPAARHYFESLRRGRAIVAVRMPRERAPHAVELTRRLHARAVDDVETGAPPVPSPAAAVEAAGPAPPADAAREQVTVPVVEERLEVGKRQVQRGGVRIHSQVVEEPVEETVSLREERVHVERRPVYRDATDEEIANFKEGSIEFHETVEEPVITKRRRVVEEIVVGREMRERTEKISETVRKTRVRVEELDVAARGEQSD